MRPLVLISGLAPGGAERVAVSLLVRLQRGMFPTPLCTVTSRHDGPLAAELERGGVDRCDLEARRLADPRALVRLVRLLRAHGIDLIHAHGQDAAILGAAAARVRKARLVITRHVLDEPADDWRQRARAGLTLLAFRSADTPVAVSRAAADRLSRLAGVPADEIRVLPNGIDVEAYSARPREPAREALSRELSIPGDARLVLFPAVLRPGKGHDTLIEALPALEARAAPVRVLLAGAGELEEELRKRAAAHAHLVHFLGHRTDMPDLMAAADVVILPSRAEALPTVLVEAAAAGRPVVGTRVGGVPEIVEDGRTGILVPPDDPVALAEATASLLDDPARRRVFGERAARVARARFSLDRQAERTVALWESTMREGRA